jgi:hypothetical protein
LTDHEGVQKSDLVPRTAYALRNRGGAGNHSEPFLKVIFLGQSHKDQVKVRYESGELKGLEDWVRTRHLACRWPERMALVRDEERAAKVEELDRRVWDRVTDEAVDAVMTASGEYSGFTRTWTTDPSSAERFWSRGGLDGSPLTDHPANFKDRHGVWHLTFETAVKACKAYAAAEPELVDLYLRGWEEELTAEGFQPGHRHSHDLLRAWAPAHALARAWSQRPQGEAAEREVARLQRLAREAAATLRRHGHESEASRIERGLRGR